MKSWCNIFQKTNCLTRSQLPFAKLESKRAANLCFHLCEAVKERTVSCHGCELVDLGSVKATTFFFFRGSSFECHLHPPQPFDLNLLNFKWSASAS